MGKGYATRHEKERMVVKEGRMEGRKGTREKGSHMKSKEPCPLFPGLLNPRLVKNELLAIVIV